MDDVPRHQLARRRAGPPSIALDLGLDRQLGFQGGNGVTRLMFFPKSDHGIRQQ